MSEGGATLGNDACNLSRNGCLAVYETSCWNGVTLCNDSCNLSHNRHRRGPARLICETSCTNHFEGCYTGECWKILLPFCRNRCKKWNRVILSQRLWQRKKLNKCPLRYMLYKTIFHATCVATKLKVARNVA